MRYNPFRAGAHLRMSLLSTTTFSPCFSTGTNLPSQEKSAQENWDRKDSTRNNSTGKISTGKISTGKLRTGKLRNGTSPCALTGKARVRRGINPLRQNQHQAARTGMISTGTTARALTGKIRTGKLRTGSNQCTHKKSPREKMGCVKGVARVLLRTWFNRTECPQRRPRQVTRESLFSPPNPPGIGYSVENV